MAETIFAVSSGAAPAAIGVIRISGPQAGLALQTLAGRDFQPRRASVAKLADDSGKVLDEALVLWFPGPRTATGEDLAELHCHGGRAVLSAVQEALNSIDGLAPAEPGEFTRRAFANGRIDLAESEGLADLLSAETELQRAAAMANASGQLSGQVERWRAELLRLSAQIEAALDFSDEDDVSELPDGFTWNIEALANELGEWLARPKSEKLGEGYRVVLAGPPNSGKSTLFNALIESEAAITSPIAGTTRDVIERSVSIEGIPFLFVDTAGLRDESSDEIEGIGIDRAKTELQRADTVLWLGAEGEGPKQSLEIDARIDESTHKSKTTSFASVSAHTGVGVMQLKRSLIKVAQASFPKPGEAALNARQHHLLTEARDALEGARSELDLLLVGEELRRARVSVDRLIGRTTTEDMLDALFGRFCIGK
ncbi:tRNA uridine-5-carboxymethylaminomethyl(34) synthesis GTPase MnmE [Erythrobacter crassostreae]|uniref:tRNA modification GTPase MnmE n=1 Tax=Erythrobacter crassostreae TaxID=2828328 RepID=A0A9X1F305_9SPHN|nr:tRNA uridine-5-carboxymethylaminomethyl(34) synthesis GTPase MnmE [Erythrobacter crassostrea]MBV7258568.1 tRNA uridine-5-carboxymethylaminomethyl(34) synthesis GTPase MnmE [Erythrobacter crassostrea]